jgi:hypothetical protein
MPYFDRIRRLAAARGAPARRQLWGLEVEEFRPAAATPSAPAARTPQPAGAAHVEAGVPPRVAAPTPTSDQHAATPVPPRVAAPPARADARPLVRADARPPARDLAPPASNAPRPLPHAAPPASLEVVSEAAAATRPLAAPPLPLDWAPAPTLEFVSEAAPLAPAVDAADPASPRPRTAPTQEAEGVVKAPVNEPTERARRALAEVRRWMEEPPRSRDPDRPPRAPFAVTVAEPPLSIGTIEVTVEAAPAPRPPPAVAPPPRPARRAGRDVVPRDYLRGW